MIYISGIDVSRYQNEPILDKDGKIIGYKPLNYLKPRAYGVKWAVVRATVGDYYIDPTFAMNYMGYHSAGYRTMLYMVTAPKDGSGRLITWQAHLDKLHEALSRLPVTHKDYIIVDNELSRGATPRQITALIEKLFANLPKPMNYTGKGWWDKWVLRSSHWKDVPLLVANYRTSGLPLLPVDYNDFAAWQWSADGNGKGKEYGVYSSSIDLSRWRLFPYITTLPTNRRIRNET